MENGSLTKICFNQPSNDLSRLNNEHLTMLNQKVSENSIRHGAKRTGTGFRTSPKMNLLNKHINGAAHLTVDWQFDERRALSFEDRERGEGMAFRAHLEVCA
jgi:hypothetical protein